LKFPPDLAVRECYHRLLVIGKAISAIMSRRVPDEIEAVTHLFVWAATDVPAENLDVRVLHIEAQQRSSGCGIYDQNIVKYESISSNICAISPPVLGTR
jgi:hypothetical protein